MTTTPIAHPAAVKASRALKQVRDILSTEIGLSYLQALLSIYANNKTRVPMGTIRDELGVIDATISRMMLRLGDGSTAQSIKGLGLVRMESEPADIRVRLVSLTPKGEAIVEAYLASLGG